MTLRGGQSYWCSNGDGYRLTEQPIAGIAAAGYLELIAAQIAARAKLNRVGRRTAMSLNAVASWNLLTGLPSIGQHDSLSRGAYLGNLSLSDTGLSLWSMPSIVLLTNWAPSTLGDELQAAGIKVWEAISMSEALHLCEHHHVDLVVISYEAAKDAILPLYLKQPTISLQRGCRTAEVIWQLQNLLPAKVDRVHLVLNSDGQAFTKDYHWPLKPHGQVEVGIVTPI